LCKIVLDSVMYAKYCHNDILFYFPVQLNNEPYGVLGIRFCDLGNAENGTTKHGIVSVVNI
jgi:hypothetical protein